MWRKIFDARNTTARASTHASCQSVTPSQAVSSAYVHIPFCRRRCFYCDFPIAIAPPASRDDAVTAYVSLLVREIEATAKAHGGKSNSKDLQTVYFGGGTPSLAPVNELRRVMCALDDAFGVSEQCEVNLELDPGTALADAGALATLTTPMRNGGVGVTRFSVGVQTLDDALLVACGRAHDAEEAHEALRLLREVRDERHGALRYSVDVMTGLPHHVVDHVDSTLDAVLSYEPDHISLYDLQVEERTKFGRMYTPGVSPLPSDAEAATMLTHASRKLANAGFERYEVSSYSRGGREARSMHNEVYWSGAPYHAFGVGAASYLHRRRFTRPRGIASYDRFVQALEKRADQPENGTDDDHDDNDDNDNVPWELLKSLPDNNCGDESPEVIAELALETVMLRLRTSDGLDVHAYSESFGRPAARSVLRALIPHARTGHVAMLRRPNLIVRLTDPEGWLLANDIISDVFLKLDEDHI